MDALGDDHFHEECGVFGVFHPGEDVANLTYFGLYSLQHRGQESAGIAVSDGETIRVSKEMGLVSQVFDQETIDDLKGYIAIGHTRYSTTGSAKLSNAQPMRMEHPEIGPVMIGHNGNLVNATRLRDELSAQGVAFETTSDTEVIGALLAQTHADSLEHALAESLPRIDGAYCLVFLTKNSLVAARDPLGIRPLCLGRFGDVDAPGGTGYVIASETCALDVIGATFLCEIEPGEIVTVDSTGMRSTKIQRATAHRAMCSFEFIYFARPDSVMMGKSLYEARRQMGRELAREAPADGDIVITLPDSGTPAAIGYAEESGLPFAEGMIKSRYITRTFIQPTQRHRRAAPRGCNRGAHAHRLASDRVAVLHGHRHRVTPRAHRRGTYRARDRRDARRGLTALSEPRRPPSRDGQARRQRFLFRLFHRLLSGRCSRAARDG
jgi:amidophosphoribosyltransferase